MSQHHQGQSHRLTNLLSLSLSLILTITLTNISLAQSVPYTGIVVENRVEVRASAGRAFYPVGELRQGDRVRVREVTYGWYRIDCPEGVHSYVSKAFVDAKGDGKVGVVNRDRTDVKAGSLKGPGESYHTQLMLNQGDTVNILGESGSFYKIAPPPNSSVFLPPGSVRPASALELERPRPEPEPEPEPVREPQTPDAAGNQAMTAPGTPGAPDTPETTPEATPQTPQTPETPTTPQTPQEPQTPATEEVTEEQPTEPTPETPDTPATPEAAPVDDVSLDDGKDAAIIAEGSASEALEELEQRMLPKFLLPVEEQPNEEMTAAYKALQQREDLSAVDQRIIAVRLMALERNRQLAQALKRIEQDRQQVAEQEREAEERRRQQAAAPVRYDAVGTLMASSVYDGVNMPRMFRLVDPREQRTIAYVEPGGPVEPHRMLGNLVGIVGNIEFDAALKLRVISVQRIDALGAQARDE